MVAGLTARISRAAAVDRVRARYPALSDGACLMCTVLNAPDLPAQQVAQSAETRTVLSRFGTRPGHLLVIPTRHVESVAAMPDALWLHTNRAVLRATRVLEAAYAPARVYVASLGSASLESTACATPMTCAHVHVHVIPVRDPATRPAQVLTWQGGVVDDTHPSWEATWRRLTAAFADSDPGRTHA